MKHNNDVSQAKRGAAVPEKPSSRDTRSTKGAYRDMPLRSVHGAYEVRSPPKERLMSFNKIVLLVKLADAHHCHEYIIARRMHSMKVCVSACCCDGPIGDHDSFTPFLESPRDCETSLPIRHDELADHVKIGESERGECAGSVFHQPSF